MALGIERGESGEEEEEEEEGKRLSRMNSLGKGNWRSKSGRISKRGAMSWLLTVTSAWKVPVFKKNE